MLAGRSGMRRGSRRVQRSVRLVVATILLSLATVLVATAVATASLVGVAAAASLLAGIVSCRIVSTEVTQTRRDAARQRAELAREFGAAMSRARHQHSVFTATMASRLAERDTTIVELYANLRLAERRAADAEIRVKREARRANEAQQRLSQLLDEVLLRQSDDAAADAEPTGPGIPEAADLPTVVELLVWEQRVSDATAQDLRRHA